MAFINTFCVKQNTNCESITVEDTSGLYDASTNPTGWNTPNISTSNVTAATVTVITPSAGTFALIATANMPINSLEYFDLLVINPEDIGGTAGSVIPDGTYEITVKYEAVALPGGEVEQVREHYIHCSTTTCVKGMFTSLEISDCSCDTIAVMNALYAFALHISLEDAVQCSQREKITSIEAALNKICGNTNSCNC